MAAAAATTDGGASGEGPEDGAKQAPNREGEREREREGNGAVKGNETAAPTEAWGWGPARTRVDSRMGSSAQYFLPPPSNQASLVSSASPSAVRSQGTPPSMASCSRRRGREGGAVEREVPTGPPPRRGSRCFFKFILSGALDSGKLGIPKNFLRRRGKDLSNSVLLKVPDGSTWTIELEKRNHDMVLLGKGWREFMEHYSIGYGHFIVFKYKENSTFHVIIFDKSASEIDYSSSRGKTSYLGSELFSPEAEDVVETDLLEDVTPHQRMRMEPHLPCSQLGPSYSPRGSEVPIDTDPEEPHLSQAQAGLTDRSKQPTCGASHSELDFHGPMLPRPLTTPELTRKINSEYPFFKKVIRRSYMSKLSIPGGFIKQHKLEKQRATLRHANRSWSVRLGGSNGHVRGALRLFFSAGWHAFARETHLRIGDVCMFELIDRDDIVFEVSILSVHRRNKLSKRRVNHHELVFRGPTPPKPPTTPEVASEFESEHPFFKVVIRLYHKRQMYVPLQFSQQYIQENKEMATLRFSDRLWPVKLLRYTHKNKVYFSAGWHAFARETDLRAGNVCLFELINRDETVFKVSILRGAGNDLIHVNRDEHRKYYLRPLQHRNEIRGS